MRFGNAKSKNSVFHLPLTNLSLYLQDIYIINHKNTKNMRNNLKTAAAAMSALLLAGAAMPQTARADGHDRTVANPIDLNYRFQPEDNNSPRREAADPVAVYFKGYYYLFASKSGGYWRSPDMAEWEYIPCKTIKTIEDYAPSILAIGDELYYMSGGGKPHFYKNATPEKDTWTEVESKFAYAADDPSLFMADDGRVYLYQGCHDKKPITGVEVDPKDGFRALGEPETLINHNSAKYGWEAAGADNELDRDGYNEGAACLKYNGKYYLQYAAPGTQWRNYGDGIYVSDSPLGPFTYVEDSPFTFKPGGFIGGTGHGHTFQDKYGNYWHVGTMKISVRHMFERRLGLFPVVASDKHGMYAQTTFADYPFTIPDRKVDFTKTDIGAGWGLLSYRKAMSASSSTDRAHDAGCAADEQVETWWAASTGKKGEWLQMDLGGKKTVKAVQVNFADHNATVRAPQPPVIYKYIIEGSADGKKWTTLVDASANTDDAPHRLHVLPKAAKTRYLRITNMGDVDGCFSLYDLRVFGKGTGKKPARVTGFKAERDANDSRMFRFSWDKQEQATGYILYWGTQKDCLTHTTVVYDNKLDARYFNRDSEYYFDIKAFNEAGVGE